MMMSPILLDLYLSIAPGINAFTILKQLTAILICDPFLLGDFGTGSDGLVVLEFSLDHPVFIIVGALALILIEIVTLSLVLIVS